MSKLSALNEMDKGLCPPIDFHSSMHDDCLTQVYFIYDILSLLPFTILKYNILHYRVSDYMGVSSALAVHNSHSIIFLVTFVSKIYL